MNVRSQIQLVTIDLDDTLWPCMPTIMHAENTSYAWLQQNLPDITARYSIDDLRDKRKALMRRQPDLINDLSEARRAHFRELADELGYSYDWIDEGFKVFHAARQKVEFYADVIPVLERLTAHFKLVALTNGNADIEKVGLGKFFDLQVSAADVAAAKPHPAMFIEAMNQLDMKPEQTLHVGDHEVHDIQGARLAGIRSVWINRQGAEWQAADYSADFEIADLYGLLELLMD